jgi:thioredoxin-disulfide reductase
MRDLKDLIIIGGGPAGMTAAIYAKREKLDTLLLTREFGGQMAKKEVEIDNFPGMGRISAQDLIAKFRDHARSLDVAIEMEKVVKISKGETGFVVRTEKGRYESKAVLLATGADPRFLGVPGEKEFVGRGVGYCATCDGPLFASRTVVVVGGGNAAFESALFLARFAAKIYILEGSDRVRAAADIQDQARETKKIAVIANAKALEILGEKFVTGVKYLDQKSGKEEVLGAEGVFIKIGSKPASLIAEGLADLNESGEIKFDINTYQTKTPGLFVAGDVSSIKYKQIVIACGEGAKAVLSISEHFRDKGAAEPKTKPVRSIKKNVQKSSN